MPQRRDVMRFLIELTRNVLRPRVTAGNGPPCDIHSLSPLLVAIATPSVPAQHVRYLLQHGADVNDHDQAKNSAMHYAVLASSDEKINILLEYGANLHAQNKHGYTAQALRLDAGKPNLLREKIQQLYALLMEDEDLYNEELLTYWPLFTVPLNKHNEFALHFLAATDVDLKPILHKLKTHLNSEEFNKLLNQRGCFGKTLLHYVVEGRVMSLHYLLEHAANLSNVKTSVRYFYHDNDGREIYVPAGSTALHALVYYDATGCRSHDSAYIKFLNSNVDILARNADQVAAHEIPGNRLVLFMKRIVVKLLQQENVSAIRFMFYTQKNLLCMLSVLLSIENDEKRKNILLAHALLVLPLEYIFSDAHGIRPILNSILTKEFQLAGGYDEAAILCQHLVRFFNAYLFSEKDKARAQLLCAEIIVHLYQNQSRTHTYQDFFNPRKFLITLIANINIHSKNTTLPRVEAPITLTKPIAEAAAYFCHTVTQNTPTEYLFAQIMLCKIFAAYNKENYAATYAALVEFAQNNKAVLIEIAIAFGLVNSLTCLANDISAADQNKNLIHFSLTRRFIGRTTLPRIIQILLDNGAELLLDVDEYWPWQIDLLDGNINPLEARYKKLKQALAAADMVTIETYTQENMSWLKVYAKSQTYTGPLEVYTQTNKGRPIHFREKKATDICAIQTAIQYNHCNLFIYLLKKLAYTTLQQRYVIHLDPQHWVNCLMISAVAYDAVDIFHYLVAQGANLNIIHYFIVNDQDQGTLLHLAALNCGTQIMSALLKIQPHLLVIPSDKKHILPIYVVEPGLGKMKNMLLWEKASILEHAIRVGNVQTVARYAAENAYWFCTPLNTFRQTVWHIAAMANQPEIITFMVEERIKLLLHVIKNRNTDLIQYHLKNGYTWFEIPRPSTQQSALDFLKTCLKQSLEEDCKLAIAKSETSTQLQIILNVIEQARANPSVQHADVDSPDYFDLTPCEYLSWHETNEESTLTAVQYYFSLSIVHKTSELPQLTHLVNTNFVKANATVQRHLTNAPPARINLQLSQKFPKLWGRIPPVTIRTIIANASNPFDFFKVTPKLSLYVLYENYSEVSAQKQTPSSHYLAELLEKNSDVKQRCVNLAEFILNLPSLITIEHYDVLMELVLKYEAHILQLSLDVMSSKKDDYKNFALFFQRHLRPSPHIYFYIGALMHDRITEVATQITQDSSNTLHHYIQSVIAQYQMVSNQLPWHYIQAQWNIAQLYLSISHAHEYVKEYITALNCVIQTSKSYIKCLSDPRHSYINPRANVSAPILEKIRTVQRDAECLLKQIMDEQEHNALQQIPAETSEDFDVTASYGYTPPIALFPSSSASSRSNLATPTTTAATFITTTTATTPPGVQ